MIGIFTPAELSELKLAGRVNFHSEWQPRSFQQMAENNAHNWLFSQPEGVTDTQYGNWARAVNRAASAFPRYSKTARQVGISRLQYEIEEELGSEHLREAFAHLDELMDRLEQITSKRLSSKIERRRKTRFENVLLALLIRDYLRFNEDSRLSEPEISDESLADAYPLFAFCRSFLRILRKKIDQGSWPEAMPAELIRGAPLIGSLNNLAARTFRDRLEAALALTRNLPASYVMVDSVLTPISSDDLEAPDPQI